MAEALAGVAPRLPPDRRRITSLSGLEALEIGEGSLFVNVGERSNVAGSKKFARLVREAVQGGGGFEAALSVALEQVEAGAQAVDINLDEPLIDAPAAMRSFLNLAAGEPELSRVPFMIDSSDYATLIAALRCVQGRCVVNSLSLKEGELPFLEKAREIFKYGAAVVVMAFDEAGQADSLERRVSLLERAHRLLTEKAGYASEDIILDPNIFAVGTGIEEHRRYALDFFEATRALKSLLPGCLVSGGVSNVSFAFRGNDELREAMHCVFLYHAKAAGMDMGIVNPASLCVYDEIEAELRERIEDLFFDRRPDATERLVEAAARLGGPSARGSGRGPSDAQGGLAPPEWRRLTPSSRLVQGLVKGVSQWAAADAEEAMRELGGAYQVISGPLIDGMNKVGDLFGSGKLFLPQVVKSARVMKAAVSALLPYLEEGGRAISRGKVVLATVKGDVHDIGKNIVSVVLQCNGYEIVDLGVMASCEDILDSAERESAVAVGLSGLITPSLDEMARVAREMERRGMKTPLLVGGAATSPAHTALRIASVYSGPVVNVRDASLAPGVMARLVDEGGRPAYERELACRHEELREASRRKADSSRLLSLEEARARAFHPDFSRYAPQEPALRGVVELRPSIGELVPYIDWRFFFHEWGFSPRAVPSYPAMLDDPSLGPEARRLKLEAERMLADMEAGALVSAAGLCSIFPAASRGDDMLLFADDSRRELLAAFPFLRQQRLKDEGSPQLCLADYLAPEGQGPDWAGLFAVTAGLGLDEALAALESKGDEFGAIMIKILSDRLAEALAERMHEEVRRRIWGYAADESHAPEEPRLAPHRGIRPAPGYPSCPDHRDKAAILELLGAKERIGMSLTESYMMMPAASVSGFYFAAPESRYFALGRIGPDQLADYAARRGESVGEAERAIRESLG